MKYPQDFPEDLKSAVDVALSEAEAYSPVDKDQDQPILMGRYVCHVFRAFMKQIQRGVELGYFNGERTRSILDEFLRELAFYVYDQKQRGYSSPTERWELYRDCKRIIAQKEDWVDLHKSLAAEFAERAKAADSTLTLGAYLKGLRERAGLTQQFMADQAEIGIRNYQKHESGEIKNIREINLIAYEKALSRAFGETISLRPLPKDIRRRNKAAKRRNHDVG